MPTFLLINPLSGSYSTSLRSQLLSRLEHVGINPEILTVTGPEDARRVCAGIEEAVEKPVVIVAGGDGTINAVINALTPGRATVGILPVGTANVLAHELGIRSVTAAIECIASGNSRQFAVGLIERENGFSKRFVLMAGIGVDGSVVHGVRPWEKRLLKKGAYLLSALRSLLKWPRERFLLVVDGHTQECHSVIICNGARYGGNLTLVPKAEIFEPSLDFFCITSADRRAYLGIIKSVLAGSGGVSRSVVLLSGTQATVSGNGLIQVDGDFCGRAPVKIGVLANFAKIFTP